MPLIPFQHVLDYDRFAAAIGKCHAIDPTMLGNHYAFFPSRLEFARVAAPEAVGLGEARLACVVLREDGVGLGLRLDGLPDLAVVEFFAAL